LLLGVELDVIEKAMAKRKRAILGELEHPQEHLRRCFLCAFGGEDEVRHGEGRWIVVLCITREGKRELGGRIRSGGIRGGGSGCFVEKDGVMDVDGHGHFSVLDVVVLLFWQKRREQPSFQRSVLKKYILYQWIICFFFLLRRREQNERAGGVSWIWTPVQIGGGA
jgi:hypothetical protein